MKILYRYYMLARPFGPGAQPKGVVDWGELDGKTVIPSIGHHAWAWIEYDHPLTAKEVYDYELEDAGASPDFGRCGIANCNGKRRFICKRDNWDIPENEIAMSIVCEKCGATMTAGTIPLATQKNHEMVDFAQMLFGTMLEASEW